MGEKTLKEKTFSGFGWSALDKLSQQVFVFISGVLLARTLGREAYGLIGVLAIFVGIANILQESGFTSALIRKKKATETDYTTIFYTNISIGFTLYVILFFCAPFITAYYEQPILTNLARFLFLSFLFNSFSVIQNARLLKSINYKQITKINFSSVFFSYSIALCLAYLGYGVWALASQIVVLAFTRCFLLWVWGKWIPREKFSYETLKQFFAFSSKLMLGSILNSFSTNIPQNVIGKEYSLGVTGLYNQAVKLFNTASEFLTGTIQSVPYTVLSQIEEANRFKKAVRKFARVKAFIAFPIFMGMILVADVFIVTLLGQEWIGAVPILQLLCLGGIFTTLDTSNTDILRIKGKSSKILFLDIFRTSLIFVVIVVSLTLKLDYIYMIAGFSVCFLLKYIVSCYMANRMINYTAFELIKDQSPYFIIALFSTGIGYSIQWFINNNILLIVCQIAVVLCLYNGILYIAGSAILKEFFTIVRSKIFK